MATPGRPRSYQREQVVAAAMRTFWRVGYTNAGIGELTAATGLSRSSLYREFGDKAGLFEAAIAAYAALRVQLLDGSASPTEALQRWFAANTGPIAEDHPAGCLIVDSLADVAALEPRVADVVLGQVATLKAFFHDACAQAWAAADRTPPADPDLLADRLLALHHGMNVMAASGVERHRLQRLSDSILGDLLPR